ncbi:unnamed protein product [Pieris macdunnoughi]|uniref:Uncharacterized protein n=1 Tax=Pieris macdunnoughi TaxID=345717 RepID=A0A821YDG5_9NEOP|nr:unnamed protein product [Pieris macdunnoughi]
MDIRASRASKLPPGAPSCCTPHHDGLRFATRLRAAVRSHPQYKPGATHTYCDNRSTSHVVWLGQAVLLCNTSVIRVIVLGR